MATAWAANRHSVLPFVLEAADRPGGSWPHYYESLTLFSLARFSALPGLATPGDPEHYPLRDEVVTYLRDYASRLDADLRYGWSVSRVERDGDGFVLTTAEGSPARTAPCCQGWRASPGPCCTPPSTVPATDHAGQEKAVSLRHLSAARRRSLRTLCDDGPASAQDIADMWQHSTPLTTRAHLITRLLWALEALDYTEPTDVPGLYRATERCVCPPVALSRPLPHSFSGRVSDSRSWVICATVALAVRAAPMRVAEADPVQSP